MSKQTTATTTGSPPSCKHTLALSLSLSLSLTEPFQPTSFVLSFSFNLYTGYNHQLFSSSIFSFLVPLFLYHHLFSGCVGLLCHNWYSIIVGRYWGLNLGDSIFNPLKAHPNIFVHSRATLTSYQFKALGTQLLPFIMPLTTR